VKNLEEASDRAIEFLEIAGYPKSFVMMREGEKKGEVWDMRFDFSRKSRDKILQVIINDEGKVVGFDAEEN